MAHKVFRPDPALEDYALEILRIVGQVTGVPRFAIFARSKRKLHVPARVVFREVMKRTLRLSMPEVAHLLGIDHRNLVGSKWRQHEDLIQRVLALLAQLPRYEGAKIQPAGDMRCPTCGRVRTIGSI